MNNLHLRNSWVVLYNMGRGFYPQLEDKAGEFFSPYFKEKGINFSVVEIEGYKYFLFATRDDAYNAIQVLREVLEKEGGSWSVVKWLVAPAYNYLGADYHSPGDTPMEFLLGYSDGDDDVEEGWKSITETKWQSMKLTELINHIIKDKEESDLTPVDNWKATDCMYLEDMGFKNDGTFHYALKNPEMRLSHKKHVGFVVEDIKKHHKQAFKTFKELEEYFANYKQDFEDTPYL